MSNKQRIVLALKDDDEASQFLGALKPYGYEISVVKDGASALEAALRFAPSLIAADADLPVIDGRRLFGILRSNQQTSKVPFVFISDADHEVAGIRHGSDAFFIRPYNIEEVSVRIRQAIDQRAGLHGGAREIEGTIRQMPLADMIQFLELNKKEGELRVSSGGARGVICVKEGQIYNCTLGGVDREKALYRLLGWKDGRFEFVSGHVDGVRKLRQGTGQLLMEGMRQIDELARMKDSFPASESVLKAKSEDGVLAKGLNPLVHEIMKAAAAYPKVEDLVEHVPYPDYEVYTALVELISKGALTQAEAAAASLEEVFSIEDAIAVKEWISRLFNDAPDTHHVKVFIVPASAKVADAFVSASKKVPGITPAQQTPLAATVDYRLGESFTMRLPAGLDVVFFSVPAVAGMGPLIKAFSSAAAGAVFLWDADSVDRVKELIGIKREILAVRQVPFVHIFAGTVAAKEEEAAYRKAFGMKHEERLFCLRPGDERVFYEALRALFSEALSVLRRPIGRAPAVSRNS